MSTINRVILASLLCLGLSFKAQAALTCHIHPPQSGENNDRPVIVGPYDTMVQCEQANAKRFIGKGRCHCSFDNKSRLQKPSSPNNERFTSPEMLP